MRLDAKRTEAPERIDSADREVTTFPEPSLQYGSAGAFREHR